jgi:hypothetical protein
VNNKFRLGVIIKREYPDDGLVAICGTAIGQAVKAGDEIALVKSTGINPMGIVAVLPGIGTHELLIAVAQTEETLKSIRVGDVIVRAESSNVESEQAVPPKQRKEAATLSANRVLRATAINVLQQYLSQRKAAKARVVSTNWRDSTR